MTDATPPLHGRTAVVTGASRGIGLAIATALVGAGARVAMLARTADTLHAEARTLGVAAHPVICDLTRAQDVVRAADDVSRTLGTPDVLVHNAGLFLLGPMGTFPPEELDRTLQANLVGPYRVTAAFLPAMLARRSGHVVTIGSIADRATFPENGAYSASKFGARAMHQVLREELRGTGVRASLISPGPVDTPLWDPIDPDTRAGFTPRSRMLAPDAVADAVLWVVTRPATNVDELRLSRG